MSVSHRATRSNWCFRVHDVYAVQLVSARFLALDLGAESGRAILGRLDGGVLTLKDVRRFPNVAVRTNGSLHWDILRLWHEVKTSLEDVTDVSLASVGLDTWGCDYALLGEQGQLLENPYHYRDTRSDDAPSQVFRQVSANASTRPPAFSF
jgi:rhamnulokinase